MNRKDDIKTEEQDGYLKWLSKELGYGPFTHTYDVTQSHIDKMEVFLARKRKVSVEEIHKAYHE